MFSPGLVGESPTLVSIAGGKIAHQSIEETLLIKAFILGVVQNTQTGFDYDGESNLDLEYTMNLVNFLGYVQNITLYQVGDLNQGISISTHLLLPHIHATYLLRGGSFNTLLDALDGSYSMFEGGDDPAYDPVYPDSGGYNRTSTYRS